MIFERKIEPEFLDALRTGQKTFEVRKEDDSCPFAPGDFLALNEYTPTDGYTGRCAFTQITYVLRDPRYCLPGTVILGLHNWLYSGGGAEDGGDSPARGETVTGYGAADCPPYSDPAAAAGMLWAACYERR